MWQTPRQTVQEKSGGNPSTTAGKRRGIHSQAREIHTVLVAQRALEKGGGECLTPGVKDASHWIDEVPHPLRLTVKASRRRTSYIFKLCTPVGTSFNQQSSDVRPRRTTTTPFRCKYTEHIRRRPEGAHPLRGPTPLIGMSLSPARIRPRPAQSHSPPLRSPALRYLDVTLASANTKKASPKATPVITAIMPTGRALDASSS